MLKALRDYRRGHSKRVPSSEKEKMWNAARAKYPDAKKSITYRLIDLRYRVLTP
jgi:hypothetical protein